MVATKMRKKAILTMCDTCRRHTISAPAWWTIGIWCTVGVLAGLAVGVIMDAMLGLVGLR